MDRKTRVKKQKAKFNSHLLDSFLWVGRSTLFAFCLFPFYFSCTADPDPTLSYKDREIVDSLFRMEVDTLKVVYDSLCEVRFDSAVNYKVDSIMKVRESEIEKYLKRIKGTIND